MESTQKAHIISNATFIYGTQYTYDVLTSLGQDHIAIAYLVAYEKTPHPTGCMIRSSRHADVPGAYSAADAISVLHTDIMGLVAQTMSKFFLVG